MTDFRRLTDLYYVADQLSPIDIKQAKSEGFDMILCNRPDGEVEGQPTMAQMQAASLAENLKFETIPIGQDGISAGALTEGRALVATGDKILAYCRTGTRSTILHALISVAEGEDIDTVISNALEAGYDLAPFRARLEAVAS
ncbi:MAG: TIGR01244 family sulfur transferase [Pseudomonadota bacterium]